MLGRFRVLRSTFTDLWVSPRALYARRARTPEYKDHGEADFDPDDPQGYKELDAMEEIEDWFDVEKMKHLHDAKREENQRRNNVKKKIIEKKFFPNPQEINLLTWDAKEQIRYLHQEFPDEWTVEQLSESFPISKDGICRLLRSFYRPKTLNDLLKHDKRVRKNWKNLLGAGKGQDAAGPIVERYRMLKESGHLELLGNAGGIRRLPKPDWEQKLLRAGFTKDKKLKKVGTFESIVKDYSEQKQAMVNKTSDNETVLLSQCMDENRRALDSVVQNKIIAPASVNKSAKKEFEEESWKNTSDEKVDSPITLVPGGSDINEDDWLHTHNAGEETPITYTDNNNAWTNEADVVEARQLPSNRPNSLRRRRPQTMFEAFHDEDEPKIRLEKKKSTTTTTTEHVQLSDKQQISMGMAGTSKLRSDHDGEINVRDFVNQPKLDLQFDTPKNSNTKEAFIYDPESGYQHPYGRKVDLTNIDVPRRDKHSSRQETVVYQDGKNIYDEDGEFLYKLP